MQQDKTRIIIDEIFRIVIINMYITHSIHYGDNYDLIHLYEFATNRNHIATCTELMQKLSSSGLLKKDTVSNYTVCIKSGSNSWLWSDWSRALWLNIFNGIKVHLNQSIFILFNDSFFNVDSIFCWRRQFVSKFTAYIVASLAWEKNCQYQHMLSLKVMILWSRLLHFCGLTKETQNIYTFLKYSVYYYITHSVYAYCVVIYSHLKNTEYICQ